MYSDNFKIIKDRAEMFSISRAFFEKRKVTEVDCPIMSANASIDIHIDLIRAYGLSKKTHYLQPSPEYGMKKLLSNGMGDIYQLSHVFRDNEYSMNHNPEFTMVEWYRIGVPLQLLVLETVDFINQFLGEVPYKRISYRDLFLKFTRMDYLTATEDEIIQFLIENGIDPNNYNEEEGKDALFNIILEVIIQPQLGKNQLCILEHFPASQAMSAKTCKRGKEIVSERFEIFFKGIELANGYNELTNPVEQLQRLKNSNRIRERLGKETLPIDDSLISALRQGLPDCCGVAVRFDRLMMIRHDKEDIADVITLAKAY